MSKTEAEKSLTECAIGDEVVVDFDGDQQQRLRKVSDNKFAIIQFDGCNGDRNDGVIDLDVAVEHLVNYATNN